MMISRRWWSSPAQRLPRCLFRHPSLSSQEPQSRPSSSLARTQICLSVTSSQPSLMERQLLPPQPRERVPIRLWEFWQRSLVFTSLRETPFSRQEEPPQPAHWMPSVACEFAQISGVAMSLHILSVPRQYLPPQPFDLMPSSACEFKQIFSSVMRLGAEPCSRQ